MFLTCLLNSRPPALKRNSFGILFHCFAAKYLKEFNPYFVVFTFGSDSVLLPLKSYLLFLISTSSLMHVGAVPWKQAFIVINMSWTRRLSVTKVSNMVKVNIHEHWTRVTRFNPLWVSAYIHLEHFPFVRPDRPDNSRHNENFTFNQNYPARSVKS